MYRDLISAAINAGDSVSEDLAVTVLSNEEVHRAEIRGFKREYEQDGAMNRFVTRTSSPTSISHRPLNG